MAKVETKSITITATRIEVVRLNLSGVLGLFNFDKEKTDMILNEFLREDRRWLKGLGFQLVDSDRNAYIKSMKIKLSWNKHNKLVLSAPYIKIDSDYKGDLSILNVARDVYQAMKDISEKNSNFYIRHTLILGEDTLNDDIAKKYLSTLSLDKIKTPPSRDSKLSKSPEMTFTNVQELSFRFEN